MTDLISLEKDPRLFLYTSLTAGSSHIVTATSRLETILRANKIPFQAIDLATDEQAKKLWQRRGGKRKLPGLVKEGFVLGDLNEVEEWNEFGELRENIGPVPAMLANGGGGGGPVGIQTAPALSHNVLSAGAKEVSATVAKSQSQGIALPGAAEIAARGKAPVKMMMMGGPKRVEATDKRLEGSETKAKEKDECTTTTTKDGETKPAATGVPIKGGPAKFAAMNERLENVETAAKDGEEKVDGEKASAVAKVAGGPEKVKATNARLKESQATSETKGTPEPNAAAKELKIGEPPIEDVVKSSEPAPKPVEDVVAKTESEEEPPSNLIDVPARAAGSTLEQLKDVKEIGSEEETDRDIPEDNAAAAKALKIGESITEEAAALDGGDKGVVSD